MDKRESLNTVLSLKEGEDSEGDTSGVRYRWVLPVKASGRESSSSEGQSASTRRLSESIERAEKKYVIYAGDFAARYKPFPKLESKKIPSAIEKPTNKWSS